MQDTGVTGTPTPGTDSWAGVTGAPTHGTAQGDLPAPHPGSASNQLGIFHSCPFQKTGHLLGPAPHRRHQSQRMPSTWQATANGTWVRPSQLGNLWEGLGRDTLPHLLASCLSMISGRGSLGYHSAKFRRNVLEGTNALGYATVHVHDRWAPCNITHCH